MEQITVYLKKWDKNGQNRVYLNANRGWDCFGFMILNGDEIDYSNVREDVLQRVKDAVAKYLVKFKKEDEEYEEADVVKYRLCLDI